MQTNTITFFPLVLWLIEFRPHALIHCTRVKLAAILQLSQYCTFDGDSISTVITEPGQPVKSSSPVPGRRSICHPPIISALSVKRCNDNKVFLCIFAVCLLVSHTELTASKATVSSKRILSNIMWLIV